MRITFLFVIYIFTTSLSFAQTEKVTDKKISEDFEQKFNSGNFNGIFDLFSIEMKNTLSKNDTNEYLSTLKKQTGQIQNREFNKYVKGTFASYITKFEYGVFSLHISTDNQSKINGLFIEPFVEVILPKIERNTTKLVLPFKDKWTVTWGGDTAELNYHVESKAQKNAFDFVITDKNGKSYKTNGKTNEDYYAFGKKLIAPCDGKIVLAVDGIEDNIPGEINPIYIPGNTVILKTINNEYLFFAHFKQNSIEVKLGQEVKKGEVLGLSGNSGNSSEPHLHFHIQNVKDMNVATGVKCYFEEILVEKEIKKDYSPIKGDKIKQVK
ncbi:M23 family metallopeptidase [uncultured Maribacter sp.]|uniref:M23 family metallopeptidase n=1 Tax=uncultured Maribacter sp. TaxID=431308 RepID=UPI00261A51F4|nr:M23 family metallopeptidase [uncultured Maribacter sp.]